MSDDDNTPQEPREPFLANASAGIAINATPVLVELYLYGMHHGLEQAAEQLGDSYEKAHHDAMVAVQDYYNRHRGDIVEHVLEFVQTSATRLAAGAEQAGRN